MQVYGHQESDAFRYTEQKFKTIEELRLQWMILTRAPQPVPLSLHFEISIDRLDPQGDASLLKQTT